MFYSCDRSLWSLLDVHPFCKTELISASATARERRESQENVCVGVGVCAFRETLSVHESAQAHVFGLKASPRLPSDTWKP